MNKPYKVLIVEDEPLMRSYLFENISRLSPDFVASAAARDGLDALPLLEDRHFDLVITDIKMPGLDGIELVKRLRESGSDVPVILLSGYDEFEYARAGLRLGVAEYLLKPVNDDELSLALRKIAEQLDQSAGMVKLPGDWSPESIQRFISDCFADRNREQSQLSERAAKYIADHFTQAITQTDVAEALGITPAYLSNVFHEEKGESYTKFLTRLRMTQAALLLKSNPDLTVQAIAEMTGYVSDKHFISVFKKFFGETPNEYRRGSR